MNHVGSPIKHSSKETNKLHRPTVKRAIFGNTTPPNLRRWYMQNEQQCLTVEDSWNLIPEIVGKENERENLS